MMERSRELFGEALKIFPGGVNSPVRAAVKPFPFYVLRGEGPYLHTEDGQVLVDYVLGYGPLILGHRHPEVLRRVKDQVDKGWLFGTPTELEILLAKKILGHFRADMIRFVNSGTEATMLAVRLARAVKRRDYIIKFEGCYHGAHDYLLVGAGSAASHFGVPKSEGIPKDVAGKTLVAQFNDLGSVESLLKEHRGEVSAVIVEPVIGNYGLIPPEEGFIKGLRELTSREDVLLIMDEVITGFRLSLGGAQEYFGVQADITTLGKIIGGGFPVGAVLGPEEIMSRITPSGKVFNAGTFNANPVTMAAGLATIEVLEEGEVYSIANRAAEKLAKVLDDAAGRSGLEHCVNRIASMFQIFFTKGPVRDYRSASRSNKKKYVKFHEELLKRGIFVPPSQFEVMFTSGSHTDEVVERTAGAFEEVLGKLE